MRYQGTITEWRDEQGFGFVTAHGSTQRVFVHIKAFTDRTKRPLLGQIISYQQVVDSTGRLRAMSIEYPVQRSVSSHKPSRHKVSTAQESSSFLTLFPIAFFIFLIYCVVKLGLPFHIIAIYFGASMLTFLVYALDKSAAQAKRWRTKEDTLHVLALLGGWPGALMAQNWLRHKSKKTSFQVIFWITVALNCAGLSYILTKNPSFLSNIL